MLLHMRYTKHKKYNRTVRQFGFGKKDNTARDKTDARLRLFGVILSSWQTVEIRLPQEGLHQGCGRQFSSEKQRNAFCQVVCAMVSASQFWAAASTAAVSGSMVESQRRPLKGTGAM